MGKAGILQKETKRTKGGEECMEHGAKSMGRGNGK